MDAQSIVHGAGWATVAKLLSGLTSIVAAQVRGFDSSLSYSYVLLGKALEYSPRRAHISILLQGPT